MATYQAYAEYKDSGVEWLEVIPSHWTSIAIKFLALDKNSLFLDGDWIESKDISDSGIRYITTGNVGTGFYKEQGSGFITEFTFKKLSCSEVYAGDILISRLNLPIGRACIVPDLNNRIVTSVDNVIFRPDEEYHPKFLVYLFSSKEYFQNTENIARGATMQRISRGLLGNIRVVMPSKDEQTQIANFLDHETAKIDHLIEKQQQLIELLKEKRQAVISHAVTKGLNPNVPMKDSGVEWLGEVPEHWIVCPIKYELKSQDFRRIPLSSEERGRKTGEYRYYGASGVIDYIDEYIFDESTVLVGEDGANLVTRNTPLAFAAHGQYWVNNHAHILKPTDGLADYWAEVIEMIDISSLVSGSAQPKLTAEALNNLKIAFSEDMNERVQIEHFIKQTKNKYDVLIDKAQCQVSLLSERRTALISAAVTGKIDVRHWKAPTVAEADTELSA